MEWWIKFLLKWIGKRQVEMQWWIYLECNDTLFFRSRDVATYLMTFFHFPIYRISVKKTSATLPRFWITRITILNEIVFTFFHSYVYLIWWRNCCNVRSGDFVLTVNLPPIFSGASKLSKRKLNYFWTFSGIYGISQKICVLLKGFLLQQICFIKFHID